MNISASNYGRNNALRCKDWSGKDSFKKQLKKMIKNISLCIDELDTNIPYAVLEIKKSRVMKLKEMPLKVYAGTEALEHIQSNGLKADDISMLLGASSGPKWLALHGIDDFLINQFFKGRDKPLHLLGTSAGAWRMACYAMGGNEAHQRLTEAYVEQRYSAKPSGQEVLNICRTIMQALLGKDGAHEILHHPYMRMNLITTQCHGLTRANNKLIKGLGFGAAAILNAVNRKSLAWQFTRLVMHHPQEHFPSSTLNDLPTRYSPLTVDNMEDAILSTGAIPMIINGVDDVAGKGMYQDGGITDYGFDLPLLPEDGFVLYPHFSKQPAPGWFDKRLTWRTPKHENYSKTIMLVPSDEFIADLPQKKIPDRHDFLNLSDTDRIQSWRKTIELTQHLAEDLSTMDWQSRVEPLPW